MGIIIEYYLEYNFIIGLFMFIAYFIFSASRKSEQNKVWAGMAKETAHQIATPLSSLIAWIKTATTQSFLAGRGSHRQVNPK